MVRPWALALLAAASAAVQDPVVFNRHRLFKDKDARTLSASQGKLVDRTLPALASLTPASFASEAPRFSADTIVTPMGSGLCRLHWASDQFDVDEAGAQRTVGTLTFTLESTDGVMLALERALGVSGSELNNIVVLDLFRGHRGGELLTNRMIAEMRARDVGFVMLRALDRGGGGLLRWYERMGFHDAREVLPPALVKEAGFLSMEFYMIGITSELVV
jgi:GNAT superfamily N-acetyltransferase